MLQAITGGNGECHCVHVRDLMVKVAALEARSAGNGSSGSGSGGDPWWSKQPATNAEPTTQAPKDLSLPLDLEGPLGAIAFKDNRPIFER